ncbi:MAG TPA: hypothetical protein VKB76_18135, partial [Ktedonobacterales bacterium]|nr:hypothetical protein [Ktedonobacterales bacterium]
MKQAVRINAPLLDRGLWWLQARWPWLRHRLTEPSAEMFTRIRLRLVAWYMGVLIAILLIAGGLLYLGMQATVLAPVNNALGKFASGIGTEWASGRSSCSSGQIVITGGGNDVGVLPTYIACYNQNGQLLIANSPPNATTQFAVTQFTDANLAKTALANNSATD